MFKFRRKLTGTRPVSDVEEVIVSVTQGNIKVSLPACDRMGLGIGDRVSVVVGPEGSPWIAKTGSADEGSGSKLAKAGSNLQFSDAGAYQELEGEDQNNRHYDIDFENPEVMEEDDAVAEGFEGETTFYKLSYRESTPKQEKTPAGEKEEVVEEEA